MNIMKIETGGIIVVAVSVLALDYLEVADG